MSMMRLIACGLLATLAAVTAGCNTAPTGAAPWQDLEAEPEITYSNAEYFHYLATRVDFVNQNDAYRAVLLFQDGEDGSKHFGQRIEKLQSRGLLDAKWRHDPLEPITRARLASIICRTYEVRGGWALTLFGPGLERAARRELEYQEVMSPGGGDLAPVAGAELVMILKKAQEEFGDEPTYDLPPEGEVAAEQSADLE